MCILHWFCLWFLNWYSRYQALLVIFWCELIMQCAIYGLSIQWRHNERDGVSNHRCPDCLPNRLFWRRSKRTWKLCVTGLCEGNSPVTGEFPAQRASNAEIVSIWWHHHELGPSYHINISHISSIFNTASMKTPLWTKPYTNWDQGKMVAICRRFFFKYIFMKECVFQIKSHSIAFLRV